MTNENKKKDNILKSEFFLKLFTIPYGVWFGMTLIFLIPIKGDTKPFTFGDFIISNITVIIIWFIISVVISLLHNKLKKNVKFEDTSTFIKIRFPFIMCIITFIIGILLSLGLVGLPLKAKILILLASFIPFILFLIITFIMYKFNEKKKVVSAFKVFALILFCLLLYYYFIALFVINAIEATNPVTNPKYYSYYVTDSRLKKAFPNKIPKNVDNVKFYYAPGFLQGGTRYTLYYVDNNMTLDKFDKTYKKKAEWIGHKNEYTEKFGLLSSIFYSTPSEYKSENDYIIYLIDGDCDNSGYCNHGYFLIAAFNEKTHEVVFSSEAW